MPCSECRTIVDDTWARYAEDRVLFFLMKEDLSWRWTAAATENPNSRLHLGLRVCHLCARRPSNKHPRSKAHSGSVMVI